MRCLKSLNSFQIKNHFVKFFSENKSDLKSRLIKNSLLYVNKLGFSSISL